MELASGSILYEAGQPILHVDFVEEGFISLMATMREGANVGREGAIGLAPTLEPRRSLYGAVVRVPAVV